MGVCAGQKTTSGVVSPMSLTFIFLVLSRSSFGPELAKKARLPGQRILGIHTSLSPHVTSTHHLTSVILNTVLGIELSSSNLQGKHFAHVPPARILISG